MRRLVQKTIASTEAKSMNDMGKIMGILMKELAESADGKLVQNIVRKELS